MGITCFWDQENNMTHRKKNGDASKQAENIKKNQTIWGMKNTITKMTDDQQNSSIKWKNH